MSDDDRTTPLGLFNYARSYWQSGVLLHDARAKVTPGLAALSRTVWTNPFQPC
jgi:hypothetical protein